MSRIPKKFEKNSLIYKEKLQLAKTYFQRYGKKHDEEVFHEYFMLFTKNLDELSVTQVNKTKLCDNYEATKNCIKKGKYPFLSYNDFMKCCFNDEWEKNDIN